MPELGNTRNSLFFSTAGQRRMRAVRKLNYALRAGRLTRREWNRAQYLQLCGLDLATAKAEARRYCLPDLSS